jgi:hypothetical protein
MQALIVQAPETQAGTALAVLQTDPQVPQLVRSLLKFAVGKSPTLVA